MEVSDHQSEASIASNDDLLTQILLRLPIRSILRFKSVSKHWQSLLNNKHFTLRYDKLLNSHGIFIRRNTHIPFGRATPFLTLHFCYDPRGIKIVQSCNGLLLCCSDLGKQRVRKYYVLNPTTQQFKPVRYIPSCPNAEYICFLGLAFHQTGCVHYKLVCVCVGDPLWKSLQVQVYSSETKKWKVCVEPFYASCSTFEKGVYWNGAIHFAPTDQNYTYFEIESERLQTMPLPLEMLSPETKTMYFGECRGHLHLVTTNRGENFMLHMNVYEMLSDCSGWFVKYQVKIDDFPGRINFRRDDSFYVAAVVRGEKEEDTFMVIVVPGYLKRYHLHEKRFSHICHLEALDYNAANVHHHIETIASI